MIGVEVLSHPVFDVHRVSAKVFVVVFAAVF